jgi:hypothetical protein
MLRILTQATYGISPGNLQRERPLLAELRSSWSATERLLWRNFLDMEGKILSHQILQRPLSIVISFGRRNTLFLDDLFFSQLSYVGLNRPR